MKIGELARLCGVSQATIRYYVKSGLLVPDDQGAQYNFTEHERRDLDLILKEQGPMSCGELAGRIADSLARREQLLKLLLSYS